MVKIITGPINSGKSTYLLEDFKTRKNADGFTCLKVRINNEHIGYELKHLVSSKTIQFIRKINHIPEDWNEAFRLGMHYSFNKEGFDFAKKITDEAFAKGVKCFYIDEVAHLELKDQGFSDILKRVLKSKIDLVLVVREALVEKICEKYGITDYECFKPNYERSKNE